jgi:hypothetical protein
MRTALRILGFINIGSEFKAEMVVEGDLLVLHLLTLGEYLVPLLCHLQLCHLICVLCPGSDNGHQQCQCSDYSSHLLLSLFPAAKLRDSLQLAVTPIKADITLIAEILFTLQIEKPWLAHGKAESWLDDGNFEGSILHSSSTSTH